MLTFWLFLHIKYVAFKGILNAIYFKWSDSRRLYHTLTSILWYSLLIMSFCSAIFFYFSSFPKIYCKILFNPILLVEQFCWAFFSCNTIIREGNEQGSSQQLDQPSPAKLSVILVNTMSSESIIMAITDIVSVINDLYTKISYYIYIKSMVL